MKRKSREAAIKESSELAAAMAGAVTLLGRYDDETLAVYIVTTERLLTAAKQEQARRIEKAFMPAAPSRRPR